MADAARRAELAVIHIAKKELGLDDDTYRGVLHQLTRGRVDSAGVMTPRERHALIEHFKTHGWSGAQSSTLRPRLAVERPFKKAKRPQARLVWALWGELKRRGALENPSREACRAFCAKTAGIEVATDPDLMTAAQLDPVINALKAWVAREKAKESAA